MTVYLTARNPTDSVTLGLLPAAARLGHDVVLLTDQPVEHRVAYSGSPSAPVAVVGAEVGDGAAVASRVAALTGRYGRPWALLSNSDHLQVATALAAAVLDLPGKQWRAAARAKNKSLMRQHLAATGTDVVAAVEIGPDDPVPTVGLPAVVKPREGVAGEDVRLVVDAAELAAAVAGVRARRPGSAVVVEEYLGGPLLSHDTLGDAAHRRHIGGWRTTLGPPPEFTEVRMEWAPRGLDGATAHLDAQLDALGVGFGACHTEVVRQGDRARIVEVNYRLVGDLVDLLTAELTGADLFGAVLRVHAGEPVPADLPVATAVAGHARIDWVIADRPGRFAAAPPDGVRVDGGVRVGHRRMRPIGTAAPRRGSNRDYLAAVWAIGPDAVTVDAAVDGFRARNDWRIDP